MTLREFIKTSDGQYADAILFHELQLQQYEGHLEDIA